MLCSVLRGKCCVLQRKCKNLGVISSYIFPQSFSYAILQVKSSLSTVGAPAIHNGLKSTEENSLFAQQDMHNTITTTPKIDTPQPQSNIEKIAANENANTEPMIVLVSKLKDLEKFESTIVGKEILAVDAEGVNLSRFGLLTVFSIGVQTSFGVQVFLFDMIHENKKLLKTQLSTLKRVLEDKNILKIIHDCRQDSDALNHQFNIQLRNVFDTSVYTMLTSGKKNRRTRLNHALKDHGCDVNKYRGSINYSDNPAFWRERPFNAFMIDCAAGDVGSLFQLHDKLQAYVNAWMPSEADTIRQKSEESLDHFRGLTCYQFVNVNSISAKKVIGMGGYTLMNIEVQTGALVTHDRRGFLVIGKTEVIVKAAVDMINKYVLSSG